VAKENQITKSVMEVLKDAIQSETKKLEDYQVTLKSLSLLQYIQTTHYSGSEILPYLQNVHVPSDNIESTRFTLD
jgi:hypothetical protein